MRFVSIATAFALLIGLATAPSASARMPRPGHLQPIGPIVDANGNEVHVSVSNLSGDGQTAFLATAAPLLRSDTNAVADVYAFDIPSGALELVSLGAGGEAADGASVWPTPSHDGRYVLFLSSARNLVAADANGSTRDAYVRDRATGTTTLVSVASDGTQATSLTLDADLSSNGRVVTFVSTAPNLVEGDTNQYADVFVHDLDRRQTERVSVTSDGAQALLGSENPAISGDGRVVAFASASPLVADDTNAPARDVYVHDRVTRSTERVSVSSAGTEGPLASFYADINHDGRYVAFSSFNPNYVPYDTNGYSETFVHDRQTGITERIVAADGRQLNGVIGVPVLSGDARYLTGNFLPDNFGYGDTNGSTDVYRVDRLTGAVDLVSSTPSGVAGNGISYSPAMSADGRFIAFNSRATDLVPDRPNAAAYLRDLGPPLGVGAVSATSDGEAIKVDGWIRSGIGPLASASDPMRDGAPTPGGDLIGARAAYRPEEADLLFAADFVPSRHVWPPLVGTDAPKPGLVTYVVRFTLDEDVYEVHAIHGTAGMTFPVYRCTPACAKVGDASGGVGTASDRTMVAVPEQLLGGVAGRHLRNVSVSAVVGNDTTGGVRTADIVAIPDARVPQVLVELAFGDEHDRLDDLRFTPIPVAQGWFSEVVAAPPAVTRAIVRVCAGETCSVTTTGV